MFSWMTIILPSIMIPIIPGVIEAQPATTPGDSGKIKEYLKPDEAMIEYAVTDSSAIVYATSGDSTLLAFQSLSPLFWLAHQSFGRKIKSADPGGITIPGQILYLYLIKPIRNFITGKKRLIIKADKRLSELPFEALILPDDGNPGCRGSAIHYLIQDFEIIYQCMQGFREDGAPAKADDNAQVPEAAQFAFMGFSPVFYNHAGLSELPDSKDEIAEIGSLFRQKGLTSWLVYREYSEKEYFKTVVNRGKIVHLSTHYIQESMNQDGGGFIFYGYNPSLSKVNRNEGVLTIREINGLHLHADLIVLNACGSGIVKPDPEAGWQSLPAIFLKAGARNILSTLWNVTDRLAGDFMINFYRLWLSGKTYGQALREVKLQMINRPETSLPTIWAPYVLTAK